MASKHTVRKGAMGRLRLWGRQFNKRRRGGTVGDSLRSRSLNLESLESRELLSVTYSVTNANDSGAGSLRQAILDANANANGAEVDRIEFNIAGDGVKTIELLSALPAITDPVAIDGYTQAGSSENTLSTGNNAVLTVELDGASAGAANGLTLTAGNTTVQGLVINSFNGDGIALEQGDSNVIQGNYIGTNAAGTADLGNTGAGISVTLSSQKNTIGTDDDGTNDLAEVNIISGNNGSGILVDGYGKNDIDPLVTPSNNGSSALDAYIAKADSSYSYSLVNTVDGDGYTVYTYDLISQTWNPDGMVVNRSQWQHYLQICVPDVPYLLSDTALMIISGGSNRTSPPTGLNYDMELGATISMITGTIVVNIPNIPNESLTFADEPWAHTEDEIIAYTFDKFLDTGNAEWPAYLPMVKSVIRAMDTVQAVVPGLTSNILEVNHFALYGESKRGWTAQLVAATDPEGRVSTLVGSVSEVSNLGMQVQYWKEYWEGADNLVGGYPVHVQDYTNYDIFDRFNTTEGQALLQIIDLYAYRDRANMDIPKIYLNATGDQFFTPGSSEYYIDGMQAASGQTYLYNAPNAGHSLDQDSRYNMLYFYEAVLLGSILPSYDWTISNDGKTIDMTTSGIVTDVKVWSASNSETRDYRYGMSEATAWTSTDLDISLLGNYSASVEVPESGSVAFMIEVTFLIGVLPVKFSTSISVVSADDENVIQGNLIGVDASGTADLGNGGDGIRLVDCTNTLVAANLLAGNGGSGLDIVGVDATGSMVLDNTLGSGALANATAAFMLEQGTPSSRTTVLEQQGTTVTLTGTSGDDTILVDLGGAAGQAILTFNGILLGTFSIPSAGSLQVDGAGGSDTLTVNASSGADSIVVNGNTIVNGTAVGYTNVESPLFDALAGDDTVSFVTGTSVIDGGDGTDTVVGPDAPTTWQVTGDGAGAIGGLAYQDVENLTGGSQSDRFLMTNDGKVPGVLNGGGGGNVLDYSYYSPILGTGASVDLAAGTATGVEGSLANIGVVVGSSGIDLLYGGALADILIGGAGADTISGRGGRDLLIGGSGVDGLYGGDGDDILLAGTVAFYNESSKSLDLVALNAIMAEWTRTDVGYSSRVSHLLNGGGLNGSYVLNSSTIDRDEALDWLWGEGDRDWFLASNADWDASWDRDLSGDDAETRTNAA